MFTSWSMLSERHQRGESVKYWSHHRSAKRCGTIGCKRRWLQWGCVSSETERGKAAGGYVPSDFQRHGSPADGVPAAARWQLWQGLCGSRRCRRRVVSTVGVSLKQQELLLGYPSLCAKDHHDGRGPGCSKLPLNTSILALMGSQVKGKGWAAWKQP